MDIDHDQFKKLQRRYTKLSIVLFFLMAALRGLHFFFFTIFFWPAVGFGILAIYYARAQKREAAPAPRWQGTATPSGNVATKRPLFLIIVVAMGLIPLIAIIASRFSSSGKNEDKIENTEGESVETKTDSTDYDRALQFYNKKNYRASISVGRKAMLRDSRNGDVMLVLGDDYGSLKQYDSAFVWFDRAYQNGARSAYLSHWLGFLQDDKRNFSEAIRLYKDALQQDSTRTQLYDRLAELEPDRAVWYHKKSKQWAESR